MITFRALSMSNVRATVLAGDTQDRRRTAACAAIASAG